MFVTSFRTSSRWSWKVRLLIACDCGHTTRSSWRKSLNSMSWTFLPLHADHMQRPLQVILLTLKLSHYFNVTIAHKTFKIFYSEWKKKNETVTVWIDKCCFVHDVFQGFWIPIRLFLPGVLSQETIVSIRPPRWQMLGENCIPVKRDVMVVFDIYQHPNGLLLLLFYKKGSQLVFEGGKVLIIRSKSWKIQRLWQICMLSL